VYDEQITDVFIEFFADNRAASGRRDYYGVRVDRVADDGSILDLTLTFKSGKRYCCCEPGCHTGFGMNDADCWRHLREALDRRGLAGVPSVTIRRLYGIVECGALLKCNLAFGKPEEVRGFNYECGPYSERMG
jgi:hypothetical protein